MADHPKPHTPTWILIRGLIREQRHWESFPDQLQDRFPNVRLIMLDTPGNGTQNQKHSPASIRGLMEGLRIQLDTLEAPPPYNLISVSMGSMVSLEWLTQYPQEIDRAVVMNTSLSAFSPFYQRLQARNYPNLLRMLTSVSAEQREKQILDLTSNLTSEQEKRTLAKRWARYYREQPVARANALSQLAASARYRAPAYSPPNRILVLCGARDKLVHPDCSRNLARYWHLPFAEHPEAGHDLTLDAGSWVIDQIAEFFCHSD